VSVEIVATAAVHFEGLYQALDIVAREERYLAFLQAPPVEEAFAFYSNIVAMDLCQFVALRDGVVIGWCDVLPTHGEARAHVGTLGIGLIPDARHQCIGAQLMAATIARAWEKGYTRIELDVRVDNPNAKALYERFGFAVEGLNRRAVRVAGTYVDCHAMALLR
jgi:RimJ/RimL family protein N-acetyltransferase